MSQADAGASRNRRIAFTIAGALAALVLLVVFGSLFAFFGPWVSDPGEGPGYEFPMTHRWHDAQWGAHTGILLAGSVLALLWKPLRRPLLLQFLVVASVILGVLGLVAGDPESLAMIVIAAILVALYPNRNALTDVRPVRWNVPLLAVAVVAALVALPYAIDMFQLQLDNAAGDEHAEFTHWGLSLVLLLNLLAAGVLAATGRPGSRILGILGGVAFVYLGIAALTSRDGGGADPVGIWSTLPALLSILAGIGYLGATLMEERLADVLPKFGGRPKPAT